MTETPVSGSCDAGGGTVDIHHGSPRGRRGICRDVGHDHGRRSRSHPALGHTGHAGLPLLVFSVRPGSGGPATRRDEDDDEPALSSGDDSTSGILEAMQNMINEESGDDDDAETELDIDFDDLDLDFDDDDDAEDDGDDDDDDFVMMDDDDMDDDDEMVPLDDMIDNEDMGEEDEFDDGGFDYD